MRLIAMLLLTAAVAQASVTVSQTSDNGPHPSAMEIEVMLPDSTKILIPLTRTDAFEDIPMTLVENGVSRTFSSRQVHHPSHSHYRDIQSRSVISVRHVNGKRQISGHVMHEGTSYFLEPFGDSEHRVTKNEMNPEAMAKQIDATKLSLQSRWKRQTNIAKTTNTVELHLLIDSTVWNAMLKIFGTEATALSELHQYYTHILNGIDTAYRNLQSVSISVSCIGMTIAKTASDDAWMPGGTEATPILERMRAYIADKSADHFMAFTRIDITADGSPSVCGMAYLGAACTIGRVSINEDQGLHSWGTAAHELGHNLGSQHDSAGNSCSKDSKNLMAPSSAFYTLENVANSYRFSACSESSITAYVNSLGSSSCLLSVQGSRVPVLTSSVREGVRLTLDQVCRLSYPDGPGKMFLSNPMASNPASICAELYCQAADGSGTSSGGLRAPVGTPCGSRKSCNWNGECTPDDTAPAADETCFYGDSWPLETCMDWKDAIGSGGEACSSDVKKNCCRTTGGLAQCAGV